jgi:succinyl-diaminopimelate desuccinylase
MNTQTKILHHLKQLVAYYPATDRPENIRAVLDYCQGILTASGSFADAEVVMIDGFPSLVASTRDTKQPALLWQAHIDVVPAREQMRRLTVAGDIVRGRGVYDMLFATACYLTLLQELRPQLPDLDLGIMLTGDEETGGFHGVKELVNAGYKPDVCILPDGGDGYGDLCIGAKGISSFDVVVSGIAHHASRPWEGDGAGNKLVHFLYEFLDIFDHADRNASSACVTKLAAGDAENKGPHEATAHVNVRYTDQTEFKRIQSTLTALCAKYNARIVRSLEGDIFSVDIEHEIVRRFIRMYEQSAGKPVTLSRAPGSSDARYFTAAGVPVLMLRPDGSGAHGDQEELSLSSLVRYYDLLKDFTLQTATIAVAKESERV